MDGWILLRRLVLLEHLTVLIMTQALCAKTAGCGWFVHRTGQGDDDWKTTGCFLHRSRVNLNCDDQIIVGRLQQGCSLV